MTIKTIKIKGMVCGRCITILRTAMEGLSLKVLNIDLGSVTFSGIEKLESFSELEKMVRSLDFEIIYEPHIRLVNDIISFVDEYIESKRLDKGKFSEAISNHLKIRYNILSAAFSKARAHTLESYFISRRIDKIKEYLVYTDLTLDEIAGLTGYSSMFHLSSQVKDVTSLNPTHFREIKFKRDKVMINSCAGQI